MGEFERISEWTKNLRIRGDGVKEGIGDDCAFVEIGDAKLLLTNDEQVEGHHFKRHFSAKGIGFKLIASNVSDIFACGGKPLWANLAIALPPELPPLWMMEFYEGVESACDRFHLSITGGNTTASETLSLGAFVVGQCERFVGRKGAKVGDALMLTSTLGESRAGLELLLAQTAIENNLQNHLIKSHFYPDLPVRLVPFIAQHATAAIDISDGLAGDLGHLIEMSKVGFTITEPERLYSQHLLEHCKEGSKQALKYSLFGGEDYQIAFTLSADQVKAAEEKGAILIGTVTDSGKLLIQGPKGDIDLPPKGFEHF